MLIDYLEGQDLIRCKIKVKDWKDAVRVGCEMMVNNGNIEPRYTDTIIEKTEELGPYYVICPGVAMPHTRPDAGVKSKGISLMTLEPPIDFGHSENDPVSIVICLAGEDNQSHLNIIEDLVALLSNQSNIDMLNEADSVDEIKEILS